MTRSQLMKRIEKAWIGLMAAYEDLSESEMVETGVSGKWSVRDIIVHVTSWEDESLKHLPGIIKGKRPPRYSDTYGGIDAFNARAMELNQDLALSEVLKRRDETRRKLIEYIKSVPEDMFTQETRFRRRLRLDTYGHYPKHAGAIRAWQELRRLNRGSGR